MDILGADSFITSLDNSFRASAMGCEIPHRITLLGPFRKCIKPMTFRSIKVKKATPSKTPRMENKKSRKNIIEGFLLVFL